MLVIAPRWRDLMELHVQRNHPDGGRPALVGGTPVVDVGARAHDVVMANKIDYFEIGSPDPQASRAFYAGLFDWEIEESPQGDQPYRMVDGANGGLWDTSSMAGENWAIFYVRVEDVADAVEQAVALGASVAIPMVDNGQIYFAHLLDPQGNRFGIWHPKD